MNDRQKAMLKILLHHRNDYLSSQQIADQLECSEKTVRNDSKVLDEWLMGNAHATLCRKPNSGFRLEINELERNNLLSSLYQASGTINEIDEKERLTQILKYLLIEKQAVTIQKLSELFYVNKAIIKKDLERIEDFLEKSNLELITKRKLGIEVEGNEQDWRLAISKIPTLLGESQVNGLDFFKQFFEIHELAAVQRLLEEDNQLLENPFTDATLQSLVIHILITIKRIKLGNSIPLSESEITQFQNNKEYQNAKDLLKTLEPIFCIRFPENEIAYIALHFSGGKVQKALPEQNEAVESFAKRLIDRISDRMQIDFSEDHDLVLGLRAHLQSTIYRVKHGLSITNPILEQIKRMYPYLFDTIMTEVVQMDQALQMPEEEAAFLTLHFQASLERLQKKNSKNKRAIIVCPMGIGTSVFLRTKLEQKFHSLDILDTVPAHMVHQFSSKDIDLIISTVPISNSKIPVIEISPLLSTVEENKLQAFLENLNRDLEENLPPGNFPFLKSFLGENLILLELPHSHRYEVIEALAKKLVELEYVGEEYIESAIIREKHSSTNIGGGIAIPHGDPTFINKSGIAVGVLKKPLIWGREYVSLVLLLATKKEEFSKTKKLFHEISRLSDNPLTVNHLIKVTTSKDFIRNL